MGPSVLLPRLQILAAAALFSTGGAAIKATSLSVWQVASFRSGVAAVILALVFLRRRSSGSANLRVTPRILAVGLAYAVALCSYVVANKLTTAAATIFLVSTSFLWVLLLSPRWLGEELKKRDLGLIAALAAGMALVFASPGTAVETAANPRLGNWVAAGSGFAWALTVIGLRLLGRSEADETAGASASAGYAVVWGNA
ncbi:MAG: DMT family transporter, partial [Acidobacteriota bacterium]|nr:DMT family transporter [Acidobacteriota bacterium]